MSLSTRSTDHSSARVAFYYLTNCDLYPEILPAARSFIRDRLRKVDVAADNVPRGLSTARDDPSALDDALASMRLLSNLHSCPWWREDRTTARRLVTHYLIQHAPTVFVDGCWIQRFASVPMAHTEVGAQLTAAYVAQVEARVFSPGQRFVDDYASVYRKLIGPLERVISRSFSERTEFLDSSFDLPVLLLCIGRFPLTLVPEIVGLHLAWHFLQLQMFSRRLVSDAYAYHASAPLAAPEDRGDRGRQLSLAIARQLLSGDRDQVSETWRRIWAGMVMMTDAWTHWLAATQSAYFDSSDVRCQMADVLRRKAPYAAGYHRDRKLTGVRIDDRFHANEFDAPSFLNDLASSRFVTPGDPDNSPLIRELTAFGGPMFSVFSRDELRTLKEWIKSLPSHARADATSSESIQSARTSTVRESLAMALSPEVFRAESERKYGRCSPRQLYYYLVNVEEFPDVLPVALRFAKDQLKSARSTIASGRRPIPTARYSAAALEQWVMARHREQVDSYRPFAGAPRTTREAFIEATVQLAPLLLIDGAWLQGISGPLIQGDVGSLLFSILFEEIGEGDASHHHANIYRQLLAAMGEQVPAFQTREFVDWPRFRDESFDRPAFWLSLSLFPRHFLPEILGLNLGVELAGVGGPYLEAHDTLRHFGYPTLFVDVHNAADNVAAGHAAVAVRAIVAHMEAVAASEGPEGVDDQWQRVWSGVRAMAQPLRAGSPRGPGILRAFRATAGVPLIFPSLRH